MLCQFLLYSKVTQILYIYTLYTYYIYTHYILIYVYIYTHTIYLYICIYIHTFSSILFYHKRLDIVPCAIQQDLISYPF